MIDASVVGKWYLRDEALLEEADYFAQLIQSPVAPIKAPHLSRHEVANTLASACRSGRTTTDAAKRDLTAYIETQISLDNEPQWLLQEGMAIAIRFQIAIHDAVYLALAGSTGARFITADKKLSDLVGQELPFVHYLGDFQVP